MRWTLLVVAFVLLAGCGAPAEDDPGTPPGQQGGEQAWKLITWRQPGLHGAFPDPPEQAGYEIRQHPADGIPIPQTSLEGDLGPLALRQLIWRGPADGSAEASRNAFSLDEAGNVTALLDGSYDEQAAREVFSTFTGQLTRADESQVDRWFDRFWASQQPANQPGAQSDQGPFVYQVGLEGPWRMGPFVQERNATDEAVLELNPTSLRLLSGDWELSIERAYREAGVQGEETGTRQLAVNQRNVALFLVGQPGELSDEEAGQHLNDTFADLDLGTPMPGNWTFRVFDPR